MLFERRVVLSPYCTKLKLACHQTRKIPQFIKTIITKWSKMFLIARLVVWLITKKNICEQAVNPCFTKCRSNVKQVTRQTPSHLTLKQTPTKPHLPNKQILNRWEKKYQNEMSFTKSLQLPNNTFGSLFFQTTRIYINK